MSSSPSVLPCAYAPLSSALQHMAAAGGQDQAYSLNYPNSFFNRYGIWFSITRVNPTGPGSCVTEFDLYFKKETLTDQAFLDKCEKCEDNVCPCPHLPPQFPCRPVLTS